MQFNIGGAPLITKNVISDNKSSIVIYSRDSSPTIESNIIAFNTGSAIVSDLVFSDRPKGPTIINNTIDANSGDAIVCLTSFSKMNNIPLIKNNIISNNSGYGIKESDINTDMLSVQYNLFYNNAKGHYLDEGSQTYRNITLMDTQIPECDLNLEGDPLFANALDLNYNLIPGSPAINSGDPNSPLDLDGSRADIGALAYFDPSGPPLTPKNFRAIPGHAKVRLMWSPNLEPDLSHYCIYRSQINNFVPSSSDSIGSVAKPDTIYNDTGLQIATTYYYRICAVDSTDKISDFTSSVNATPIFDPNFLKVLSPDNGIFVNKTPIALKGIAVTPYLRKVTVKGIIVPIVNDTFKVEIALNEGLNEIIVIGFDSSDTAVLEQKIKIKLDSIIPQVKITTPVSGQSMNYSPIQIKGRLVETNLVSLKINDLKPVISGNLFSFGDESGGGIEISEGITWIKAVAIDSAGNQGADSVNISGIPPTPRRLYLKNNIMNWFPFPNYPSGTTQGYRHTFIIDENSWTFPLKGDINGSQYKFSLLVGCFGIGDCRLKTQLILRHENVETVLASSQPFDVKTAGYVPLPPDYYWLPERKEFTFNGINPNSIAGDTLIFKVIQVSGDRRGLVFIQELNMGQSWIDIPEIIDGVLVNDELITRVPEDFNLDQNYPNPFNPETIIKYQLPRSSEVFIKIYNITGQLLKTLVDQKQSAGIYSITWDGKDEFGREVSSGVYLYQLRARSSKEDFIETKKMILVH